MPSTNDAPRCNLTGAPYRDFEYPRVSTTPPAGGGWESSPATFRVEEIPLYAFVGEGEHAALIVEKENLTTREVAAGVATRLGLSSSAVGYAGMKDKASVSVQGFTVTGVDEQRARGAFEAQGCRVLSATRHRNKLRLGHLAGNRFRLLLRGADLGAVRATLGVLACSGVPNYFGPQRFGARGDNAAQGLALLRGRARVSRWKRDLLVSALQAFVFNEVLACRVESGDLGSALPGDVLRREDSGGLFVCAEVLVDAARVGSFEVSPTGPMHGRKMVRPDGHVAAAEAAVLQDLGLDEKLFGRETGTRRALRVPLGEPAAEGGEDGVWLSFGLPAGAFASSVVREVAGIPGGG